MARGRVYRRRKPDGSLSNWNAVIDLPKGRGGTRKQVTRTFATIAEAHSWLAEMAMSGGGSPGSGSAGEPVVSEYLGEWLDGQIYLRPSTKASYRVHIEKYLIPEFGNLPMSQVTVPMVEHFAHDLAAKGLAAGTVQRVLATLRSAMSYAVRTGVLAANPARGVRVPASVSRRARTWTPEESTCFLARLGGEGADVLLRLALTTGMRRGELLGLRWSHLSLSGGFVRVQASRVAVGGQVVDGPPKSRHGIRTVYLDSHTVGLLGQLRDGREADGQRTEPTGLVFTRADGQPLSPWWVSRHFEKVVLAAGLPRIRFHDLRHSSATLGLAAGESLKEVSARLGHAGIGITADIYADVLPESARRSTDRRVALMTGAHAATWRGDVA